MRKLVAAACLALGLIVVPNSAQAEPIGLNGCSVTLIYECSIFVDDETGHSTLDASALAPGWLVGYTFLLNATASLADGIQESDVAHALVFHDNFIDLYTATVTNPSLFSGIVAAALAGTAIDGVALTAGQIIGLPVFSGVTQLDGVGYFLTADSLTMGVNWGDALFGGTDALTVHTALPTGPGPDPVPEPGTLSLLVLGGSGAIAAMRRRRARQNA